MNTKLLTRRYFYWTRNTLGRMRIRPAGFGIFSLSLATANALQPELFFFSLATTGYNGEGKARKMANRVWDFSFFAGHGKWVPIFFSEGVASPVA